MSHMKTLNRKGHKNEPCGTPNIISRHKLNLSFFYFFSFYFRGNDLLILRRFCQNHVHPVWHLKVGEMNSQVL